MSNVKISFVKKIATITEMKLTLEQMGIIEEALQHIAECTPDDKLEPIKDLVEKFGFDLTEVFYMEPVHSMVDTGKMPLDDFKPNNHVTDFSKPITESLRGNQGN